MTSTASGPALPRIAPLAPDDPVAQATTVGSDRNDGKPLNIFLTLARNEGVYKAFSKLGTFLLFKGGIPAREREIVILRVGYRAQSEYEFGQHTVIGIDAGLSADEVTRLAAPEIDGWSDDDAALLRLADELCAFDVVSDDTWQRLTKRWNDEQMMELLVLAGFYRLVSGMLNSVGVPLEPSTPGWPDTAPSNLRRAPRDSAAGESS